MAITGSAGSPDKAVAFLSDAKALEEGLHLGRAGVWRWKIDSEELEWTRNLESVHQLPPGSFDGTLKSFQQDVHPEDAPGVWRAIMESIETGAAYQTVYRTAPRENASAFWIETRGGITRMADGTRYLTGICLDVTKRVLNERALQRRLDQQQAVARFGSFALGERNLSTIFDEAVKTAAEVLDVPLTKILEFADSADHLVLRAGLGWADGIVGHGEVGIERSSQAGYTLLVNEPVIVRDLLEETRFSGPPLLHEHGVRSGISVVIPGSGVRPAGVFGIHTTDVRSFDQTDAQFLQSLANIVAGSIRHAAAANHQSLLVREMSHRAGNMMQLISSIAAQTFNSQADMQLAAQSFNQRLNALARSNYVISRDGWTSTRFAELVDETLKPFGSRVVAEGRDILLAPDLCFDMGLILHELATNSLKYGTFAKDEGVLNVKWALELRPEGSQVFRFEWTDPISSYVTSEKGTGFGSKLIRGLVRDKWKGAVYQDHASHFQAVLEIPISG
ncbi:MAG: sensor histidine kinase [Glycocaulis sp.]|mgnify:FL=1